MGILEKVGSVATATSRPLGLDSTNVYKTQNRRTAAIAASLIVAWVGYNKFLSNRFGLSPWMTKATLLAAETGIIIHNKRWTINKGTDAWWNKEVLFLAKEENGKLVLDDAKLTDILTEIQPTLENLRNEWKNEYTVDTLGAQLTGISAALTDSVLFGAIYESSNLVAATTNWAKPYLSTPEKAKDGTTSKKGLGTNTNTTLQQAMTAADAARKLALIEIFVAGLQENAEDANSSTLRLRTPAEARTYIEQLKPADRKRLSAALQGNFAVYSIARGMYCQKPDGKTKGPGYANDWNALENADLWWKANPDAHREALRNSYNLSLEQTQTLAFVQTPFEITDRPVKDEQGSGFTPMTVDHLPEKTEPLRDLDKTDDVSEDSE